MTNLQHESKRFYVKIGTGEKLAYGFWGFGSDLVFQTITIYFHFVNSSYRSPIPYHCFILFSAYA